MASGSEWRPRAAKRFSSGGAPRGGDGSLYRGVVLPAGGATLPRSERLRDATAFERLFHGGSRLERESFILLWVPAPGPRAAGFAAGRRLGGSVVRNRVRRRLREAYRRQKTHLPAEGLRLCFVARRGAVIIPFPALVRAVGSALRAVAAQSPQGAPR